nr:hypothetical protein HAGR004_20250 [Bdellovibrio sp. HAGR004]
MNASVTVAFQMIISRHFNFKDEKIAWEAFDSEWKKAEMLYQDLMLPEEKSLLGDILSELSDVIIHMPGDAGRPKTIDWAKWMDDDEYLKFLISKEALGLPLSGMAYQTALQASIGSGFFKRPYKDSELFRLEIGRFLKGFVSGDDKKKYRIFKFVQLHPEGREKVIVQRGLSLQEAMNAAITVFDGDIIPEETPFFEEDV